MDLTVGQRRRHRVTSDPRVQQGVSQQLPKSQIAELMLRYLAAWHVGGDAICPFAMLDADRMAEVKDRDQIEHRRRADTHREELDRSVPFNLTSSKIRSCLNFAVSLWRAYS